ncbi:MAG: phospholipase D-like domain-containing protein, partial [Planctomycetota bacterium]
MDRIAMLEYITDRDIYERVINGRIEKARKFVWIATSDLKDLHVHKGGRMVPFLEILSDLVAKRVEIRLLHAKEPGPAFREDFDKYPKLIGGMERILCPRVHLKAVVIDGDFAYTGSANLTGAGMGAKSEHKR